jgi:multimeric flavodoxin WrbA
MMSSEMKALIDRAGFATKATPDMLKYKVGAAVFAVRSAARNDNLQRDKPLLLD